MLLTRMTDNTLEMDKKTKKTTTTTTKWKCKNRIGEDIYKRSTTHTIQ